MSKREKEIAYRKKAERENAGLAKAYLKDKDYRRAVICAHRADVCRVAWQTLQR